MAQWAWEDRIQLALLTSLILTYLLGNLLSFMFPRSAVHITGHLFATVTSWLFRVINDLQYNNIHSLQSNYCHRRQKIPITHNVIDTARHSLSPPYLQDILSSHHPTRQLRSSSVHQFFKPPVNSNFASRAFFHLFETRSNLISALSFKSQLKTTLFLSAYGSTA